MRSNARAAKMHEAKLPKRPCEVRIGRPCVSTGIGADSVEYGDGGADRQTPACLGLPKIAKQASREAIPLRLLLLTDNQFTDKANNA
ncbi:hypothetical protein VCV18_011660 [Metarhizium anisopliae]